MGINAPAQYAAIYPAPHTCTWWTGVHGGWDWPSDQTRPDFFGFSAPRHSEGMSVGYVDGHVKYNKWQALIGGTNSARGVSELDVQVTDSEKYQWGDLNTIKGSVE